jgi:serine protease
VAGTIAAQTDNGEGVAGVGWSTSIMPVRARGEGGRGTNYDIMQAVRYAAALLDEVTGLPDNDSGKVPAQKADIINLSLSGTNESAFEQYIYDKVRVEGIIVVTAAGNNATSQPVYPAGYNGVLAVSAVDINEQPAPYSNFGSYVDLAAPGGDLSVDLDGDGYRDGVLSTAADVDSNGNLSYRYSYLEGTSMAAAHVSGVIALMKAVNPALTPDELDKLLADGSITRDLGDPGLDDLYGYGLIDAQKAVLAADMQNVPITDTLLTVSRDQVPLGSTLSSAEITVDKNGNDLIIVQSVSSDAPWVAIEEGEPGAGERGEFPAKYRVHVDRTDLAPGEYRATISFVSGNNTVEVSVFMQVVDVADVADGALYVQLRDPKSFETVYQKTVYSEGGLYRFNFDGVAAGRYLISAGTDLDNDKVIGDGGEAYLSLARPVILQVDQNLSGLNFGAGFNLTLNTQSR